MADEDDSGKIFQRLHDENVILKFDDVADPPAFRCATVTKGELARIQEIGEFIRLGRVKNIGKSDITFVNGASIRTDNNKKVLHVDCTACGLSRRDPVPIFKDENTILLQPIYGCILPFSAAIIALLEAKETDDKVRNSIAQPTPHPNTPDEYVMNFLIPFKNPKGLLSHIGDINGMRLNPFSAARLLPKIWKICTKMVPLMSKLSEKANEKLTN